MIRAYRPPPLLVVQAIQRGLRPRHVSHPAVQQAVQRAFFNFILPAVHELCAC
jgi:hypothetical protein